MSFRRTSLAGEPFTPADDILERVLLRPVSGALAAFRQPGNPSPSHLLSDRAEKNV
jgi:hypothetical protein